MPFSKVFVFRIFKNLLNFTFLGYLIAKLQQDSFRKAKEREGDRNRTENANGSKMKRQQQQGNTIGSKVEVKKRI